MTLSGLPQVVPSSRSPDAERRRDSRAPIDLKVEYKRLNSFFADYTRNISKGGTFIVTPKPLPVGTHFVFRLGIPTLPEPLQLHGKVARIVTVEEATESSPPGMGIWFQYQTASEQNAVQQTIELLIIDKLGPFLGRKLIEIGKTEAIADESIPVKR